MLLRLFFDEHVPEEAADHLRRLGFDVLTTAEAGRASMRHGDESQLDYAVSEGRALITFNHRDFVPLDERWKAREREHCGIILSPRMAGSLLCRRLEAHVRRYSAEEHHDLLLWLVDE